MVILGAIAVLFLKQAGATSFGSAGRDVGSGLTGISSGISNLFNSFITPITGIFGLITNLFNWGGRAEPTSQGREERDEPNGGNRQKSNGDSNGNEPYTGSGYVDAIGVPDYLQDLSQPVV